MPEEPAAAPESIGLTKKIVVVTAFFVAAAALIDAVTAVATKTQSLVCNMITSLPWCAPSADPPGPPAGPEIAATKVTAFAIEAFAVGGRPAGGQKSARRDWKRVTPDRWVENYPGGTQSYFDLVGRFTIGGCPGTVVRNQDDKKHRVFIPDKGCPGMPFYGSVSV